MNVNVENENNIDMIDENSDIVEMWRPLEFKIDESYKYINDNKIFKIVSNTLYYLIAAPILFVVDKLFLGLKIEGKNNIKNINTGAISVSNHIQYIDCTMAGLALYPKKVYYVTSKDGFEMILVRHIVRLLNALPIPDGINAKKRFMDAIDTVLKNKKIVHFYPEGSLWPYYGKIRNFKSGAFEMAVRNNVPIIPMVYTYRKPKGIRGVFKRKPDLTLNILSPIYPNKNLSKKEAVSELKDLVYNAIKIKFSDNKDRY